MKTLKTKEPKLAPKSDVSIMRENASRIEAGRANLAAQKKVERKAKIKGTIKKYGVPLAIGAGTSLIAAGATALSNAAMKKAGTLGKKTTPATKNLSHGYVNDGASAALDRAERAKSHQVRRGRSTSGAKR